MKRTKNTQFLLILLVILQVFNTSFIYADSNSGVTYVTEENTFEKTKFYTKNSLFKEAGSFHVVAFESANFGSHVNGNVMTDKLSAGTFGTKNVDEVIYFKRLNSQLNLLTGSESILVVGKDFNVGSTDGGNAWTLNGSKVTGFDRKTNPGNIWQEQDIPFIDMDRLEADMVDLSNRLAKLPNNATKISYSGDDQNKNDQKITVSSSDKFNVYNLKRSDFDMNKNIDILGFGSEPQTLILNVDMANFGDRITIPKAVANGVSTGEVSSWSKANVVWNIFDSGQPDGMFRGDIYNSGAVTGSILSPKSEVNLSNNLNGTVICKIFKNGGETHRDDYVPPTKPEPEKISIPVQKIWKDHNGETITDTDNYKILIKLKANGKVIKEITLSKENNWNYTFKDLPKLDDDNEEIIYTIEEVAIDGFESSIEKTDGKFIITNTKDKPEPEKISIPVQKIWKDHNGEIITDTDAFEVLVTLKANGDTIKQITLNKNNWSYTFKDLPKYDADNKLIVYTIEEVKIDGFESSIEKNDGKFIITNTKDKEKPEKISIPVEKIWKDHNGEVITNTDNFKALIKLKANGSVIKEITLSKDNNWKHTFEDLPKLDSDNKPIDYTIEEVIIEGFKSKVEKVDGKFIVTNTKDEEKPEPEKISIPVEKVWKDHNGQVITDTDEFEILVKLKVDGKVIKEITLNKNNWSYTFKDLPKYDKDNKLINYTVEEVKISGFDSTITKEGEKFVITNTKDDPEEPEDRMVNIPVRKVWKDHNGDIITNTENFKVLVKLKADGEVIKEITLDKNNWSYTFKDLPKYKNNDEVIKYTIEEVKIEGFETSIETVDGKVIITNTKDKEKPEPEKISIPVQKIWKDHNGEVITNTDNFKALIKLKANGSVIKEITLSKDNNWKHTFEDLPKLDKDNKIIDYTIEEVIVEGFKSKVEKVDGKFIVTNTKDEEKPEPEKVNIPVEKVWKDHNGQVITDTDAFEILVKLKADGKVIKEITLNKNNWSYTFKDLPKLDKDNKLINYTVEEVKISGFDSTITTKDGKFTITNTKDDPTKPEDKMVNIPVKKVWKDENGDLITNTDNFKVLVKLKADGKVIREITLDKDNWSHIFKDLPKYNEKNEVINYTVEEVRVEGFDSQIEKIDGKFVITNTKEKEKPVDEKVNIPVRKVWKDHNGETIKNTDKYSVLIKLKADGDVIKEITLNKDNWSYTFKDLPKYNSKKEIIKYSIEEVKLNGFDSIITLVDGEYIVTNKEDKPVNPNNKMVDIPVKKVWKDYNGDLINNTDDFKIVVKLKANGKVLKEITLDKNNWSYTFKDLPKYDSSDKLIDYSVEEVRVSGFDSKIELINGKYIITNTKDKPTRPRPDPKDKTVDIPVKKVWRDYDGELIKDKDVEDFEIRVKLKADGKVIKEITLDKNNWSYTFSDLPKYDSRGITIKYTVEEVKVKGFDSNVQLENGKYVITNSKDKPTNPDPKEKTTDIPVKKLWIGKPLNEVTIVLYQNGSAYKQVKLSNANDWTHTFKDLPYNDKHGNRINYTVDEQIASNYFKEINGSPEKGFTITNKELPSRPNLASNYIHVQKKWNGPKTDGVTAVLLKDGKPFKEVVLNDSNNWEHTFYELEELNPDGSKVRYSITEVPVEGYTTEIVLGEDNSFTITNTRVEKPGPKIPKEPKNPKTNPKTADNVLYINLSIFFLAILGLFLIKNKK